ncbi:ribonuclease P protein component [Cyanobium sp. Morenito 9A2]|uniref:ribonuclease P protein component n=1 Tax=Cyanobium sp. Morenito 9A2 TaxID=2823718 RepID=UPI0020CCB5F0|nr:ribonuclease P protein component [Cyanobium sp. Morenito 9A2]MCP9848251.1 ribonuclease P protein component [Cyanobium sp. Morenito 9A2]
MVLPREHRLRGRSVFDHLYKQGVRHQGLWMVLRLIPARDTLLKPELRRQPPSPCRCAVVISTKVSKRAVQRNRLRRLLHGRLRLSCSALEPRGPGIWLLLSLKPGSAEVADDDLLGECAQLLLKAGLRP